MKKLFAIFITVSLVFLTSCQKQYIETSVFSMDTVVTLKIESDDDGVTEKCTQLLKRLDKEFSRHDQESATYKYNSSVDGITVSPEMKELIEMSNEISEKTDGAFSVYAGSITSLWENADSYPTDEQIQNAVIRSAKQAELDGNFLKKESSGSVLEFGGIAKGYACDKLIKLLKDEGVGSALISFSSSVGVIGKNANGKPWKIAIKDPSDTEGVIGYVLLESGGLSVSGDYERFYEIGGEKYNHIVDPRNGLPVNNGVHTVAVIGPSCAECDALSTAFFVMGEERVRELYSDSKEIKYLFVTDDGIFMNDSMKEVFNYE